MIEDMLDLARARLAGGIPLKREPADFGALVHRVVQEHQAAFPDRTIELRADGDVTGEWDSDRLAQVASNLIGNALQHGHPDCAIEVRLESSPGDTVVFSVENEGRIPPEVLPHLFDPFRGGGRAAIRNEGLGLGLYIVQQIVLAHGGRIDVESRETRTAFRASIPRMVLETVKL
jgi:signal transduction histidine kinase